MLARSDMTYLRISSLAPYRLIVTLVWHSWTFWIPHIPLKVGMGGLVNVFGNKFSFLVLAGFELTDLPTVPAWIKGVQHF